MNGPARHYWRFLRRAMARAAIGVTPITVLIGAGIIVAGLTAELGGLAVGIMVAGALVCFGLVNIKRPVVSLRNVIEVEGNLVLPAVDRLVSPSDRPETLN